MTGIEFLQPDIAQIRHQIRGIIESYSHEWDLVGELAQNAVDAIRSADRAKGHIEIEIDAPSKTITFSDNGCGIDPSRIAELLRPFGTNKAGNAKLIGEKGVGLSFIIFSSSEFSIASAHLNGKLSKSIPGASH